MALDVSGSVNAVEFQQQLSGLALALDHPQVRALILEDTAAPVSLAVIEWSSENHQIIIQPWVSIVDAETLDDVIRRIGTHRRQRAGLKTAMGRALGVAGAMLEQQSHCWTHTIDVSGDGRNNIGPLPAEVYLADAFDRIVVNALVVGDPDVGDAEGEAPGMTTQELRQYFEDEVIRGPGSFAIVADGYIDFARAMHLKLMRELAQPILGQLHVSESSPT